MNVLVDENSLQNIADAIRDKNGSEATYKPSEMASAISEISGEDTGVGSRQWWLDMCKEKTNLSYFFSGYSGETIPEIDTSNATDFNRMFLNCKNLIEIPYFNTSNGTNFEYMFGGCNSLIRIPNIDTSKGNNLTGMFSDCKSLTKIPDLDTSKCTLFQYMFNNCQNLLEVSQIDMSNVLYCFGMFTNCTNLKTISSLNLSSSKSVNNMFQNCISLQTIEKLDFSNSKVFPLQPFTNCPSLQNITFEEECIYGTLSFHDSPLLSDDSIQSIIDGLADLTDSTAQTINFHVDVKAKLTEEQITTITSKNWNLA
jgi:hypothetical protein